MKRILVAVIAITAVAVPATSSAGTSVRDGESVSRGDDFSLTFDIRFVNEEPTQIRRFKFENLSASCAQGGPVKVRGRVGVMKVNDAGKFDGVVKDDGGKVAVEGQLRRGGKRATGTIRATGKLGTATGCDSGRVKWETVPAKN